MLYIWRKNPYLFSLMVSNETIHVKQTGKYSGGFWLDLTWALGKFSSQVFINFPFILSQVLLFIAGLFSSTVTSQHYLWNWVLCSKLWTKICENLSAVPCHFVQCLCRVGHVKDGAALEEVTVWLEPGLHWSKGQRRMEEGESRVGWVSGEKEWSWFGPWRMGGIE